MKFLKTVTFQLPNRDHIFSNKLLELLASFGKRKDDSLTFDKSNSAFKPTIVLNLANTPNPRVKFDFSNSHIELEIINKTGQKRRSPETYQHIDIDDFSNRMGQLEPVLLDHLGFNLPWFDGIHPDVLKLRNEVAGRSAYYRFPTGENWDFILPATEDETLSNSIDLSKNRRPKLEIVSFEKSSTPLIQIDFSVKQKFEMIISLFPEGIVDNNLKNVWVYLKNPYGIDVCFVIGEHQGKDWSSFFARHRLHK